MNKEYTEYDFEKIKREAKRNEFLGGLREKVSDAWHWAGEHKREIASAAVILIAGSKQANRMIENHRETVNKKLRVWDAREGHYWPLKRQMTSFDYLELEALERRGYSKGEALRQMGLLKKK